MQRIQQKVGEEQHPLPWALVVAYSLFEQEHWPGLQLQMVAEMGPHWIAQYFLPLWQLQDRQVGSLSHRSQREQQREQWLQRDWLAALLPLVR